MDYRVQDERGIAAERARSRGDGIAMYIDILNNIRQFEEIREIWERIYCADPYTTVFVSWLWMRAWIETAGDNWFVLAVRPSDQKSYVAFLPLVTQSQSNGNCNAVQKLCLAGEKWADFTGLVCLPGYEERVVPALAGYIGNRLKWNVFHLRNIADPRLDFLCKTFSRQKFTVTYKENKACPYIELPGTYEQYVQESLGRNTRKHLRNYTRRIEQLPDFRAIPVRRDNLELQIDTILTFYQERWGVKTEDMLRGYRELFRAAFENNFLWLTTLWEGATHIAGEACFLDHKMKMVYSYTGVFNKHYARLSPGNVMTAYAIRWAIEHGFRKYSFGAGDEHYKYLFGADEHFNRHVVVTRKSFISRMKESISPKAKEFLKAAVHPFSAGRAQKP